MNESIKILSAWLEKPVYGDGVVLYEKFIGTGFMLSMLQAGADDFNRKVLRDALQDKHGELVDEQQAKIESYPEELEAELASGGLLMDERTILKERLRIALNSGNTGDEITKADTYRILAITDQLGDIYGHKDFFEQHGYLPDSASLDAEKTPAELKIRQLSLRTYVTKYGGYIEDAEKAGQAPKQKHQDLLVKYQTELHQVDQLLGALSQTNVIHD